MENKRTTLKNVIHFKSGKTLEIDYEFCEFFKDINRKTYLTLDDKFFEIEMNSVEYIESKFEPELIKEKYFESWFNNEEALRLLTETVKTVNTNGLTDEDESKAELNAQYAESTKCYDVKLVDRQTIKDFMEKWHYSHNINGLISDYCFGMYYQGTMIGAMIYGRMAMANQWKKYGDKSEDVIELRRLACINTTLRNAESYFIGKTLKYLKKNTGIKRVVSYADTYYGHEGIIYKATNFKLVGKTAKGRFIMYNGKRYHDKTIRTKYKGKLKPFAKRVKDALETGEAHYVKTTGKNIYVYDLKTK